MKEVLLAGRDDQPGGPGRPAGNGHGDCSGRVHGGARAARPAGSRPPDRRRTYPTPGQSNRLPGCPLGRPTGTRWSCTATRVRSASADVTFARQAPRTSIPSGTSSFVSGIRERRRTSFSVPSNSGSTRNKLVRKTRTCLRRLADYQIRPKHDMFISSRGLSSHPVD